VLSDDQRIALKKPSRYEGKKKLFARNWPLAMKVKGNG
jgi:hypothetical protein